MHGTKTSPFPWSRTVIALLGIAAAAWLWLGQSWAWDVTADELLHGGAPLGLGRWTGRYVRLEGSALRRKPSGLANGPAIWVRGAGDSETAVEVKVHDRQAARPSVGPIMPGREVPAMARAEWRGRVVVWKGPAVDTTRSRFTFTSVLALLIGAWGAALAWLNVTLWRRRAKPHSQPEQTNAPDAG